MVTLKTPSPTLSAPVLSRPDDNHVASHESASYGVGHAKHRLMQRRGLYPASHQDTERSGLARFLPSWGNHSFWAVMARRSRSAAPEIEIPNPSEDPVPSTSTSSSTSSSSSPSPVSRPADIRLSGSALLPVSDGSGSSPLASLLGFGESETTFGSHDRNLYDDADSQLQDDYWARLPSLSSVTSDPNHPKDVGEAVKAMWDATAEWDMESKLVSDGLPEFDAGARRRRYRTLGFLAGLVVLVGVTAVAYQFLTDLPVRTAAEREARYTQSAQELFDTLGPVANSVYMDYLSSETDRSVLSGQLTDLNIAARNSALLSSEPLPDLPVLGDAPEILALTQSQELLADSSTQALDVGKGLVNALAYTLTMSLAFDLPELPVQATREEVEEVALHLSTSIAETSLLINGLPDESAFTDFRLQAMETAATVEQIQAEYIAALRNEDPTRATHFRSRLEEEIANLQIGLQVPLGEIKTWAVTGLEQIAFTTRQV